VHPVSSSTPSGGRIIAKMIFKISASILRFSAFVGLVCVCVCVE